MVVRVTHHVRDYEAWKQVFDEHRAVREQYGATGHVIYRSLDDPNLVTVANFFPSADAPFPQVATQDIGRAAAQLLRSAPARSEVVDITGPAYSIRQLAEKLGKAMGKALPVVDIPAAGHVAALTQAGLPQILAEAFAEMYAGFAAGILVPKGERQLQGKTPIDEVIPKLLG